MESIKSVAAWDNSVIITGETGTGKEMVARLIHKNSPRQRENFMPVDCTTLTGQLFESQLFGHVKGAFTGANSDSIGFFRAADGGTIFLDEIGELPIELQAKLLRVLQEAEVTPVGSVKTFPVNVRVLCATNRDLRKMVEEGTFREDLYYRLNVMTLEVPPLRNRKDDVVILAQHFIQKQALLYDKEPKPLSDDFCQCILKHNWPGNVRQLANIVERAFIVSKGPYITKEDLPAEIRQDQQNQTPIEETETVKTLAQVKKQAVIKALNASKGKKMYAAKLLKIDHRKLGRLMEKFDLQITYK
jgi:transcriptional regulator with PAS, ATPase and Fis domain